MGMMKLISKSENVHFIFINVKNIPKENPLSNCFVAFLLLLVIPHKKIENVYLFF